MNTENTSLLSMIKDALIGKAHAILVNPLPPGITAIYYNINDEGRQSYMMDTITVSEPGEYTVQAYAIDDAGNT
jgi:hypothetical protein